ncbi:MAG: heme ABC exporter ATP-binding protein CcmA [Acidobacteriaceae bacterium]|nr:heme ABC exporter ATP-binding protein CcmA [Acidobacteriaceae bacterium]
MSEAIAIEHVWKYYGDYPALRDCTVTIAEGSCCALLGRNGAGKTTLLRILAGLSHFQRGSVRLFGSAPRTSETRRRIGFLGHGIGVYQDLSARENLQFFAQISDVHQARDAVNSWLQRVGLERVATMPVRQFSRGMRQRLALARAFLHQPNVLLLDEPFTSLDDRAIAMLSELLMEARQRKATIVLSTHQLREALAIASDVALIENGKLRYTGERTQAMLDDPGLLYRLHTELGAA